MSNPGASQLNAVSPWASFEDISFDPEHETGKTVRFYASDGTNVDFKDTMVNSLDNVVRLPLRRLRFRLRL